jgi:hypothetical protein
MNRIVVFLDIIHRPVSYLKRNVSEIETSSFDWAQLIMLLPEDGDRMQFRNIAF